MGQRQIQNGGGPVDGSLVATIVVVVATAVVLFGRGASRIVVPVSVGAV